ncbi:ABC transporter ATP-binding protein [Paenibacillus lemnae]|uniref:ABC transporter ATP-binding protein n=1 Tax=Paenibacillus lemnae TaxID=1330551 RepID=A0A848M4M3_PAELE|nr:ABC transporter ATP-binding protein [Paenibacillus lemnae]NMO95556.1 ABC transporter ATP-binding protein [Paenibacillus lemnae]
MSNVIRHFVTFLSPRRGLAIAFFLTSFIELTVLSLAPLSFKFMIDYAIEPGDRNAFFLILGILGSIGACGVAAGLISDRLLATILAEVQQQLRRRLFSHLQHLNMERFQASRAGEHVSRFTVDLPAIEGAMMSMMTIGLQSVAVVSISVAILFTLQWSMALLILAGASLIYLGPYLLSRRARRVYGAYRDELEAMTGDVQENVRGQMIIQGFHVQQTQIHKFEKRLQQLFIRHVHYNVTNASLDRLPIISLLLVNFSIIGFGSYLALLGQITLGTLVVFFTIYTSMGNAVYNLTAILPSFASARVSLERLSEMLTDEEKQQAEQKDSAALQPCPEIIADGLVFRYPGKEPALQGISFTIPAGTTAAFVGPSGSGKSTILQLILGLRQPSGGRLTVGGIDILHVDAESYRSRVGTVFQDSFLFRGTVKDNILIGRPDASMEDVVRAAEQASLHEFITGLPDGYDTAVLEDGTNFSGGQKQRIAIARALLREPYLLLLDEITSSLDPLSEAAVTHTIQNRSKKRTAVIISHRLSVINTADVIFVMNEGRLVDSGRHDELLRRCPLYLQMWKQQDEDHLNMMKKETWTS